MKLYPEFASQAQDEKLSVNGNNSPGAIGGT
jgi:hypothetical protein